jgi:uroporphyrinogen-III synthase
MGALIRLVCEQLELVGIERIETRHGPLALRGAIIEFNGQRIALPPTALAILRTLVAAGGAVVSRDELAQALPGTTDDHAMEVALGRLRQALPVAALIVKRGYRLDV